MSLTLRNTKGSPLTYTEMDDNFEYLETLSNNITGLNGTRYIFVKADGTDIENAAELQDAYDEAKTMSPSANNRIVVILGPGYYGFINDFEVDEDYIDIVSLDGNRSVIFTGTETISITANDVFIKGIDVGTKNFTITSNLNLLRVENCKGGDQSFGGGFGRNPGEIVSGTFTNCIGGDSSFGANGDITGNFINCEGGNNSFSSGSGIVSGVFKNCIGGDASFGGSISATYINCEGGDGSFIGDDGLYENCRGGTQSFGGLGPTGTYINCVGGDNSFSGDPTAPNQADGIYKYCEGGDQSFGQGFSGTLNGTLYYCRLTSGTFNTTTGTGKIRACVDGNDLFIPSLDL